MIMAQIPALVTQYSRRYLCTFLRTQIKKNWEFQYKCVMCIKFLVCILVVCSKFTSANGYSSYSVAFALYNQSITFSASECPAYIGGYKGASGGHAAVIANNCSLYFYGTATAQHSSTILVNALASTGATVSCSGENSVCKKIYI